MTYNALMNYLNVLKGFAKDVVKMIIAFLTSDTINVTIKSVDVRII